MQFLIYLAVMLVTVLIAEITRPVPKGPKRPGLEDFTFPTADATRKVPVVWGKPMLAGPNVTWYGSLRVQKITKKVKGMFTSKKQTIGYKYYAGMFMAFCVSTRGEARILRITVAEDVVWEGNLGAGRGYIDKPTIWGGDESEGGIQGHFDWCPGGPNQMQNDYLLSRLTNPGANAGGFPSLRPGARSLFGNLIGGIDFNDLIFSRFNRTGTVPAYRSTARLVWRGGYLGNSKYIKEWKAQVQRLPNNLNSTKYDIDGEANPAEILYELLIDKMWGLGASPLDIETSTFTRAVDILHAEGFGMSLIWDGAKPLEDIRNDILAHIDGAMFVNVLTGRWEMALNRAATQAELNAALVLNEDNCEVEANTRPTRDETANEVIVFWSEEGETSKWPARAQDLGLFHTHGNQFVSTTVSYLGVTKPDLAHRLATRDLGQLGYPLRKMTLRCSRIAYKVKPMARIKFSWTPLGIQNMVCTVLAVDYGTLDDNTITLEVVQDVYTLGLALYSWGGGGSGWEPPARAPEPPPNYRIEFAPYWMMQMDEDITTPEAALPILMVEAPDGGASLHYEIQYTDPVLNGVYAEDEEYHGFTPTAVLAYDYLEAAAQDTSATLIVKDLKGLEEILAAPVGEIQQMAEGLIVIDQEWMAVTAVVARADYSYALTVQRGLGDSTIARHLAGAKVWFVSGGIGRTPTLLNPFQQGHYRARLLTTALGGRLPETQAPLVTVSSNSETHNVRPLWPYPVRDVTLNGSRTPVVVPNANLEVTWKARNRASESYLLFQNDSTVVTMEAGVTHRVFLYDSTGTLMASSGDIAGTSYTFLAASVVGGIPAAGYVQVEAFRSGRGAGQRATIWFGLNVDYQSTADSAPQRLLEEAGAGAWTFWRMAD